MPSKIPVFRPIKASVKTLAVADRGDDPFRAAGLHHLRAG
jgi:hypothetical protein